MHSRFATPLETVVPEMVVPDTVAPVSMRRLRCQDVDREDSLKEVE